MRLPQVATVRSDNGGACTTNAFKAVCTRLQLSHQAIGSTKGERYHNLVETHFNIQRQLYDYQFSSARTPGKLGQRHQAFIQTYNTTTHRRPPRSPTQQLLLFEVVHAR